MSFFRYNDPLQQFIGAIIAALIFYAILKWAFSSNQKMVVLQVSAGKKDQYGLLVALPTPKNYIEAEMLKQKLIAAEIKVNLTQTYDGPALMVFELDFKIAQAVLKS